MPSANTRIAHSLVDHSIDLLRVGAGVKRSVNRLLASLEKKLVGELASTKLTEFGNRRYNAMLKSVKEMTADTYTTAAEVTADAVETVMELSAQQTANIVRGAIGVDLLGAHLGTEWIADVAANSLVQGATNTAWWEKQAQELVFKFEQQVRLGMVGNETSDQIIARIRGDEDAAGILFQTRANAAALVQTAVAEGANNARLEMYRRNDDIIRGVQQISTLDDRTTDVCAAYDGATWDLDGEPIDGTDLPFDGGPPRHWNCRSTLVPILKSSDELGTDVEIDPGARASMDGEVADTTTFADWLGTKTEEQQDAILGAGKADLWRDGKITLRDLLDQSGRPLTLEELTQSVASAEFDIKMKLARGEALAIDPAKLQTLTNDMAQRFNIPEKDITIVSSMPRASIGAHEFEPAGSVTGKKVLLNAGKLTEQSASQTIAHEFQHVRHNAIREGAWYDTYFTNNLEQLRKDDGITTYSKRFWDQYEVERAKADAGGAFVGDAYRAARNAVSETLSEMAAVKEGRAALKEASSVWTKMYDTIEQKYSKKMAPKP